MKSIFILGLFALIASLFSAADAALTSSKYSPAALACQDKCYADGRKCQVQPACTRRDGIKECMAECVQKQKACLAICEKL